MKGELWEKDASGSDEANVKANDEGWKDGWKDGRW